MSTGVEASLLSGSGRSVAASSPTASAPTTISPTATYQTGS